MVFGIRDLERDVQKFRQDIENAKAEYIDEYAEYLNIVTDFENVEQKYDFLQEEVELITKVFPEQGTTDRSIVTTSIFGVSSVLEIIAGIYFIRNRVQAWKLIKVLRKTDRVTEAVSLFSSTQRLTRIAQLAEVDEVAKLAKLRHTSRVATITSAAGFILAVAGIALEIVSAAKRKEYLEEQKDELQKHLDEFNEIIAETNDETKIVINAFSTYFVELGIDTDGVFNENKDGFLGESGQQKFDDPENGVAAQLREALNRTIRLVGELNAAVRIANRRIDRYIDQGLTGAELIEEVVFDTELPEELIQRLYIFKLRELGHTVQEATELSGLPENIVKEIYARGYLDDGKTVEDTVLLSGLPEDQVRRIFAGKLLEDELNAENPDDVLDLKRIAEQAGLPEEVVREIRAQQLADLDSFSDEEEL